MARMCKISNYFNRMEQLKRWGNSETNKMPQFINTKVTRVDFTKECKFLSACVAGDIDEIKQLLSQGVDINTQNIDGLTAVHQACIDNNMIVVQFLTENNCDLNLVDIEGWTPLHTSVKCDLINVVEYLIENGADLSIANIDCDLPVDLCSSEEMKTLLEEKIREFKIDCDMARSLEKLVMLRDSKEGADFMNEKIHPRTKASALHVAACKGYIRVLNVLVEAGANVDAQDIDGWTPLHAAAHWNEKEACIILAKNHADMTIQNNAGQTCFDVADDSLISLLGDLKIKQEEAIGEDWPEIDEFLRNNYSSSVRRGSVIRMSAEEKSKYALKDTKAECIQMHTTFCTGEKDKLNISRKDEGIQTANTSEPCDQEVLLKDTNCPELSSRSKPDFSFSVMSSKNCDLPNDAVLLHDREIQLEKCLNDAFIKYSDCSTLGATGNSTRPMQCDTQVNKNKEKLYLSVPDPSNPNQDLKQPYNLSLSYGFHQFKKKVPTSIRDSLEFQVNSCKKWIMEMQCATNKKAKEQGKFDKEELFKECPTLEKECNVKDSYMNEDPMKMSNKSDAQSLDKQDISLNHQEIISSKKISSLERDRGRRVSLGSRSLNKSFYENVEAVVNDEKSVCSNDAYCCENISTYSEGDVSQVETEQEGFSLDYKSLYFNLKKRNKVLEEKLKSMERKLQEARLELNNATKGSDKSAKIMSTELDRDDSMQRLKLDNETLKEENKSLLRVISKLSK